MTDSEERLYLETLLLESARWRISEDDTYSPIEREILDRLRRLNGVETVDENGLAQSEIPEQKQETNPNYWTVAKRNYTKTRVRVRIGDKNVWKPRSECRKEVMPGWKTKMHWVWLGENSPTVDKLSDELWQEHEQEK